MIIDIHCITFTQIIVRNDANWNRILRAFVRLAGKAGKDIADDISNADILKSTE